MTKRLWLCALAILSAMAGVSAQIFNPVSWTTRIEMTGESTGRVEFAAKIDNGWHMYSMDVDPEVGPTPLQIDYTALDGVKLVGNPTASKQAHSEFDEMFEAKLSWYTGTVTLSQAFEATEPSFSIKGNVRFSACNDMNCIPPSKESFNLVGKAKIAPAAPAVAHRSEAVPATRGASEAAPVQELPKKLTAEIAPEPQADSVADTASQPVAVEQHDNLWTPVDTSAADDQDSGSGSLWYIFFACFLGGFVALLTPCVWPMIPMTVSFFLKKGKTSAKSILDACTYGVSIIVIYLALGLIITGLFGASSLNALSTNAVVNIVFFLLLVVFAVSFFGAFDITLPSSWSNRIDNTAEKTSGLLSIFFMAFTLTLVSFSCTGPIIGTLLVEAASTGDKLGPAVGMFGFSLALAIPFCLFAMFPSLLQSAPKSGSWMNTIKVVLGFIELALSLKFLSVADLAYGWHVLDREVFIVLWIAIFVLLGMYLLGQFNFAHYDPADRSVGVTRFSLALVSLAFAMYLVPGLWGAPLKGVSAFVPPLFTQDFNLYGHEFTEYDDYEQGMQVAREKGLPVLIDFSGHGCVNCRKMEGAVLDDPAVHAMIEDNFVMIKLMVDEKKALPEPVEVEEYGKRVTLDTYGDKWSYLQRHKFNANAQPYYVILNAGGDLLSGPFSYDENIPRFVNFLERGIAAAK